MKIHGLNNNTNCFQSNKIFLKFQAVKLCMPPALISLFLYFTHFGEGNFIYNSDYGIYSNKRRPQIRSALE